MSAIYELVRRRFWNRRFGIRTLKRKRYQKHLTGRAKIKKARQGKYITRDTSWAEGTVLEAVEHLKADKLSSPALDCDYCKYRKAIKVAMNSCAKTIQ